MSAEVELLASAMEEIEKACLTHKAQNSPKALYGMISGPKKP